MEIDFDPVKDAVNIDRHGVSLAYGRRVFDDSAVVITPTIRVEDGEKRYKAVGRVDGKLWTAVHVYRSEIVRLISVRRSNGLEERAYSDSSRSQ